MTKPKSKKPLKKKHNTRERYEAHPGSMAIGSAIGAAMGALVGAAFVRKPNLFNDLMKQFGGALGNPGFLSAIQGIAAQPVTVSAAPTPHPAGGCGTPGCPTNNPHAFEEEEARVSQENPSWTHAQVQIEVGKRLTDQMERVHTIDRETKRTARKKKKNNQAEPEETSN